MKKKACLLLYSCLLTTVVFAQSHTYFFNGTFNEASTGPALSETLSCSAPAGSFTTQTITTPSGTCGVAQPVFAFNEGGGISYPNNNIINGSYTIDIFFKFNNITTSTGYQRIIDFKNSATDRGLYVLNACLNFYPNGNVGTCPYFTSNTFYLITLVRDGISKNITIYVNGTAFSTYNDAADDYVPTTSTTPIIFFRDDNAVTCEDAAGSIKYLSLKPVTSTAGQVASTFGNICSIALPLQITDFSAKKENGSVQVKWTTVDESRVSGYVIERSNDTRSYVNLDNTAAKGQLRNNYSFTDPGPQNINYYRLKIIYLDGSFKYSSVVKISLSASKGLEVFPNPASSSIIVSGIQDRTTIKLFSGNGKIVLEKKSNGQSITIDIEKLSAGVYFVEYFDGTKVVQQKLIKK
jgi:hypothetical protein